MKRYALYGTKGQHSQFLHTSMQFISADVAKRFFAVDKAYWERRGWTVTVIVKLQGMDK